MRFKDCLTSSPEPAGRACQHASSQQLGRRTVITLGTTHARATMDTTTINASYTFHICSRRPWTREADRFIDPSSQRLIDSDFVLALGCLFPFRRALITQRLCYWLCFETSFIVFIVDANHPSGRTFVSPHITNTLYYNKTIKLLIFGYNDKYFAIFSQNSGLCLYTHTSSLWSTAYLETRL